MTIVLALLVGVLFAASVYLMLSRTLVRYLFGLVLMGNAANLLIFAVGGLSLGEPAIIPSGLSAPNEPIANPLPQALILTAIVISFGLLAFAMVLAFRANEELGTTVTDEMRVAEPIGDASGGDPGALGPGEDVAEPVPAAAATGAR
jgi:multicomponent Na+:H+ antiporter subunit C